MRVAALMTGIPLVLAGVLVLMAWRGELPPYLDPTAPLVIDARPGPFAQAKLGRLAGAACFDVLGAAGAGLRPLPDRSVAGGCGWTDALELSAAGATLQRPTPLACPAAASLAMWVRHSVQPEALRHLGQRVVRIDHYGSYACRDVAGTSGRRSRHARAEALDVAALVLEDGSHVEVRRHWGDPGARGAFLRALHAGACRWFDGVLGPGYNAAHADHLHLERGGWRHCR